MTNDLTNDLTTWLLDQIAEDERLARIAARRYDDEPEDLNWDTIVGGLEDAGWEPEAVRRLDPHVSNWDPARVLAECDAKRRIIGDLVRAEPHPVETIGWDGGWSAALDAVLHLLALPYAGRPGYREAGLPG